MLRYKLSLIILISLIHFNFSIAKEKKAVLSGNISIVDSLDNVMYPEGVYLEYGDSNKFVLIDSTSGAFYADFTLMKGEEVKLFLEAFPVSENKKDIKIYSGNYCFYPKDTIGLINEFLYKFHFYTFYLEIGDSLHLNLKGNNYGQTPTQFGGFQKYSLPQYFSLKLSGTNTAVGNNNFILNDSIDYIYSSIKRRDQDYPNFYKMDIRQALSKKDSLLYLTYNVLDHNKDQLSESFIFLVKTKNYFGLLNDKHALVNAHLYSDTASSRTKREEARQLYQFMDAVEFNDAYLISSEYKSFLHMYLEYLWRIILGEDVPGTVNNYYLSKATYTGESRKWAMFQQIDEPKMIGVQEYKYFVEDFVREYPDDSLSKVLLNELAFLEAKQPGNNIYNDYNLILKNQENKIKNISDLKGEVLIVFSEGQIVYQKEKDLLPKLKKRFENDNVSFICLEQEMWSVLRRMKTFDTYWETIDFYAPDSFNPNFGIEYYANNFNNGLLIIDKSGKVFKYNLFLKSNFEEIESSISALLKERYNIFTRLKASINGKTIILVLIIISALLLILFIFQTLRKRKQARQKQHLQSELKAIRSQLNPHFLFNSITSIQNYIQRNEKQVAVSHLSEFAKLMRMTLELSEKDYITLNEEIDFISLYLKLEALRYGFQFELDVEEGLDIFNIEITGMLVQPIVENAVVHAMSELRKKGKITVSFLETSNENILIRVKDNGNGFGKEVIDGFGLKSCRDRINLINSQNKRKIVLEIVNLENTGDSGAIVNIEIPKKF